MGIALSSAHVVRGAARHRRDEHPAKCLPDLIRIDIIEQGDSLPADLIAAGNDRLGEDMNQA